MRALLDTHTFLWWVNDDPSLSLTVRAILSTKANEIYLSAATTWELAIKVSVGRLVLAEEVGQFVTAQIALNEFRPLPVNFAHTFQVSVLPFYHKDPFDRLLIAQAQLEGLIILTHDSKFSEYEVETLW